MEFFTQEMIDHVKNEVAGHESSFDAKSTEEKLDHMAETLDKTRVLVWEMVVELYQEQFNLEYLFGLIDGQDGTVPEGFDSDEDLLLRLLKFRAEAQMLVEKFEALDKAVSQLAGKPMDAPQLKFAISEANRMYKRAIHFKKRYNELKKKYG